MRGSLLVRLTAQFSRHRRRQFVLIFALTLVGAVAELVSIGAVLPFLQLIAAPATIARLPGIDQIMAWLHITRYADLLLPAAMALIATAIASALVRIVLIWASTRFVYGLTHDLSTKVFEHVIHQPYDLYITRNSAEILSGLDKVNVISTYFLGPMITALSSAVIAFGIIVTLIVINPFVAVVAGISIGGLYGLLALVTRSLLVRLGRDQSVINTRRIKISQEAIGGIRDMILDRSHSLFTWQYRVADARMRRISSSISSIASAPRYAMEGMGIVLIAALALYYSGQPGGVQMALPVLGALALGAQRLLPLAQAINVAYVQYAGSVGTVEDVLALLDSPRLPERDRASDVAFTPFRDDIVFDRVSFGYNEGQYALSDITLRIPRGARVGIVGRTGSGKTTLLDVLAGLLAPTEGALRIDGVALDGASIENWQAQVAHVPQAIFLLDDSVAANIAFGLPETRIDMDRVRDAARRASAAEFIEAMPAGYATPVGERGVRLSGGQRQRLGIARALYKRATMLILDEATSALDGATEHSVMTEIGKLDQDQTVVMIAHRMSTVAGCDFIVQIEGGRLVAQGSYAEVIGQVGAATGAA
uniref:ABC transporter ATP-binding protein n=1 Tax=uncultured Sphingomonas sp. TaxID=158754 RepID=UPI0035C99405